MPLQAACCAEHACGGPFCQDTRNGLKLEPQPDAGAVSKYSSTTHETNEGDGVIQFSEMPPGNHLLAAKPGAGGGPPDGANLARLENNQVKDGDTPNFGRAKVTG